MIALWFILNSGRGVLEIFFQDVVFHMKLLIFFLKLNTNDGMEYLKMIARDVA